MHGETYYDNGLLHWMAFSKMGSFRYITKLLDERITLANRSYHTIITK